MKEESLVEGSFDGGLVLKEGRKVVLKEGSLVEGSFEGGFVEGSSEGGVVEMNFGEWFVQHSRMKQDLAEMIVPQMGEGDLEARSHVTVETPERERERANYHLMHLHLHAINNSNQTEVLN